MTSALSQIFIAILMVAVTVTIFAWLRRSEAAASARRMMGMISRVGLEPGDARIRTTMKETRRRCQGCPREDYCERWLACKIGGENTFCPNAPTFAALAGASERVG